MAASSDLESGFTWRAALFVVIAALVFIPASTYLNLIAGVSLGLVGTYALLVLFAYVMRLLDSDMKPQEVFTLYVGVGSVSGIATTAYYLIIYRMYFVQSPISQSYSLMGVQLPEVVPDWLAPPLSSTAYRARTFFHPDLAKPLVAWTVATALAMLAELSLVIIAAHVFVEIQKLPFPYAQVDASIVEALSSGQRFRETVGFLAPGLYVGLSYGSLLYLGSSLGFPLIPLPFIDLTRLTSSILPGAVIGLATSLMPWAAGMVVPFGIASVSLAISLAVWVFGNSLILTNPALREAFPEWVSEYYGGMDLIRVLQRSQVRVWLPIQIGAALGFAALTILKYRKALSATVRVLRRSLVGSEDGGALPSLRLAFACFLASTLSSVAVFHYLLPNFPIIIALLTSLGVSFLLGLISAAVVGESGASFSPPPYLWHTIVYLTPAEDLTPKEAYAAFVYPPVIAGGATGGGAQAMKVALLTRTKPIDVVKVWVFAYTLGLVINLLSLDFFWRIAPIPSSAYPNTIISMPASAMIDSLLVTRALRIQSQLLVLSAIGTAGLAAAVELAAKVLKLGVSSAGLMLGLTTPPVYAIPLFAGSAVSRLVLRRFLGERWERARSAIVAGVLLGEGLAATIAVVSLMLVKSAWLWPW